LSNDGLHDDETLVAVAPVSTRPVGVVGAIVSGHALVFAVVVAIADRFPAAS
jgi:hypothetical protein